MLQSLNDQVVALPTYDRREVRVGIVHFGVGGFHRAHQAMYLDRLMNDGLALDWGVCGVGVLPADRRMRDVLAAQDGLYTLVVKHPDGSLEPRVVGSLVEYLLAPDAPSAVVEKLADPDTRIVSLTITARGYNTDPVTGVFLDSTPEVRADLLRDPGLRTTFGLVTEALVRRRNRGHAPFTVLSCDNLQGNGDFARRAFTAFATLRDPALGAWVGQEVSFPNTMVDRITPLTTTADVRMVRERWGIDDAWPVVCEPFTQWVVEDRFPAGRPPLEDAGVEFVDDVTPYEVIKLRLLNGSHQALAYFAHLAGHQFVHEACRDPLWSRFLQDYMDHEVGPSLPAVASLDLEDYKRTLLQRFASAAVSDTVARLCATSAAPIVNCVLPVVREGLVSGGELQRAAAIVASWTVFVERCEDSDGRTGGLCDDPLAFIADRGIPDDLVQEQRFIDPYLGALGLLRRHGPRATLAFLAGG